MKAEKFLLQLEKQTGFHFYYDTTQLTSVIINISVNKQSLPEVLKLAFVNTLIGFSLDDQNNVFISRGQVVHTGLPDGFFAKNTTGKNFALPDSNISYEADIGNKAQNATEQNRLYSIGEQSSSNNQSGSTITGFISDNKTGEPVIGASVKIDNKARDVITDQFGYYTLSVPNGRHTLSVQSIGMKDAKRENRG